MFRRINKLKNVGRFAHLRSENGNEHEFDRFNVVVAPNGSGKTTLCDLFRSIGTGKLDYLNGRKRLGVASPIEVDVLLHGSPAPRITNGATDWTLHNVPSAPRILVYDDRFVAEHVLVGQGIAVDQRRNLYGLVLGARAQALKIAVDAADHALGEATNNLNAARTLLDRHVPVGFTVESFRPLPADASIDSLIGEAEATLETARRTRQSAEAIRQRRPFDAFAPPSVPDALDSCLAATLDDAALQAEAHIREHLAQHTRGLNLEWIAQGHRAQVGQHCPHCGQDMSALSLLSAYRAFFSGALQSEQARLQTLLQEAEARFGPVSRQKMQRVFESQQTEQQWWRDAVGVQLALPSDPSAAEVESAMLAVHGALTTSLRRKQAQPGQPCVLSAQETSALEHWRSMAGRLTAATQVLRPLNEVIAQRKQQAGATEIAPLEQRIAALRAQKSRHSPEVIDAFRVFDEAGRLKSAKEREKTRANQALREESAAVLAAYGERINALLESFGAGYRIVSEGVSFAGGPPAGQLAIEILGTRVSVAPDDAKNPACPSLANTLSGGDRSALGLVFFIALTESDPQLGDTVVVFDDPFHSQDRSRRGRTLECIQRVAQRSRQTFVLSHELDFALAAASYLGASVRTFQLNSVAEPSVLTGGSLPQHARSAFDRDYHQLTNFLESPAEYAERLKDVARCIRQTLEAYLRVKFPREWRDNDWLGDMIGRLRIAQPGSRMHEARHLVDDLTAVNEWGKRYYHAETDGAAATDLDVTELASYVRQTIRIISR